MRHNTAYILIAIGLAIVGLGLCVHDSGAQTRPAGRGAPSIALLAQDAQTPQQIGSLSVTGYITSGSASHSAGLLHSSGSGVKLPTNGNVQLVCAGSTCITTISPGQSGSVNFQDNVGNNIGVWAGGGIQIPGTFGLGGAILGPVSGANLPVRIQVQPLANPASGVIIDTSGGAATGTYGMLEVRNNGVNRFKVDQAGIVTAFTPIQQSAGGTGAGALTCSAGNFITSNGTAYSCAAVANGAIVASANISSTGVINKQSPASVISSVTKGSTGAYTINLTGMTTTGIATCTPFQGASPGYMCTATANSGTITIGMVNGANGLTDQGFSIIVASL